MYKMKMICVFLQHIQDMLDAMKIPLAENTSNIQNALKIPYEISK